MDRIHTMTALDGRLTLEGKVAIVTGASRGIGRAIAELFACCGVSVVLQDINEEILQETCSALERKGYAVAASPGDVSRREDVQRMTLKAIETWGRVDILVNNAGIGGLGKTLQMLETDEWQRMIDVDLTAVFLSCRAVLPHMIAQKRGSIINISSITAQMGVSGSTHYAAAKAGVIGFSKSLAQELAPHYINVNVIAPGLIDTEMARARGIDHQSHLVRWPRIGTVDDIAWAAAYLASDQAEFITGAVLNVNGGAYM